MTAPLAAMPKKGLPHDRILQLMKAAAAGDADYRGGRTWSLVYFLGDAHTRFLQRAYNLFFSENALNPMAFLSLKRFEADVVRMAATMLHGDREVVGTMTSGGTESCLLAVKTYRDRARALGRRTRRPEMIVPESVHVAFEKAAEYFDVKAVHAPLDKNYRVDVRAVKKLINRNTILLVGSAPSYPHGVIDPIEKLGALALRCKLPLHVDSCLGGFLLPFVEQNGGDIPPFDFRVPGVTSISADVHKYGFAAKGASVILYRNMDILKHQFVVYGDWPGGVFASPALLGTRPGGAIAAAWAAMHALGEDGYRRNARDIMATTRRLQEGVNALPELRVLGEPAMSVFAFASTTPKVNILVVGDRLEENGWHVDRQQRPDSLHVMVTPLHAKVAEKYLADLREAVAWAKAHPERALTGGAAMYGMISSIPLRGMVTKSVQKMMMEMYGPEGKMPDPDSADEADWAARLGLLYLTWKNRLAEFWPRPKK